MPDGKLERLGIRGTLVLIESALRLVGGASATGALASGVAYHAFVGNALVQNSIKAGAVVYLLGVVAFTLAYAAWFITNIELDHLVRVSGEEVPDELFQKPIGTAEQYRTRARVAFVLSVLLGTAAFGFFLWGLAGTLGLALRL